MAGMKVVVVKNTDAGDVDMADLEAKAKQHADELAALMVTYPSTYGVFDETISEVCAIVHKYGGQVYLDGANMNAMVGSGAPGRHRRRRLPSESSQDVLHSARRRRSGHGSDRRGASISSSSCRAIRW